MKRKVVQKLMCAMLASSMLMTGFGVEAFASEDKNQQELSTEAPVTDEKVTYTIACQLSPNWGNPAEGEFWQWLEEKTNVHIEWVTYLESEATEKFKLLMASR